MIWNRRVRAVARWEFVRFTKPRDLVIGTLFFVLMFGGGSLIGEFGARKANETRIVGLLQPERLGLAEPLALGRFELRPHPGPAATADSLFAAEVYDAVLAPEDSPAVDEGDPDLTGASLGDGAATTGSASPGAAASSRWQLRVTRTREWVSQLEAVLAAWLRQERLMRADPGPEILRALQEPAPLRVVTVDPRAQTDRADALTALLIAGAMMFGLFIGFSYVFVAITAEKTQRTTESLLSALQPQEWIDGKITGLTGVVIVNLATLAVGYVLWNLVNWAVFGKEPSLPSGAGGGVLAIIGLFSVTGFLFWFTFFALVAATIDDPNSSSRSGIMFLPFLPLGLAFAGLDSPDALWMRALSILPGTSPVAMPVRLLRGEPGWVEAALSFVLLAAGAALFRWMAGRSFGLSMLMTGKEPGLREVLRWMREAP